jgi:hypothetical protein
MEKLPDRLYRIVTDTINSIAWNSLGCDAATAFHYRYHKNQYGAWTVVIHPAVHEVIGGKDDGALIYPKFNLSIHDIIRRFDDVTDIVLSSKESKLFVDGIVGEHLFSLEIMEKPPARAKVSKNFNWYTKEVVKKA